MKTHFFVKHWVAAFAIAVLTIVVGVVSLQTLPVEQYPDIAPPMVTIQATYSGADAHAVMESVVMPLEEVVNGVENMIYMDATATANGEGEIDIYFKQGTDADQATVNVQNRVSQASGVLPAEVIRNGVTVQKNVNATLMIMSLESTDGRFDQSFISNYLDINVMPAISRIAGVGRTMVMGEQYGVRIWLKPDLMGIYGVTPDDIIAAINEQNLVVPIGRLESSTDKIDIEFNGLLDDMSQFEEIIISASEKGEVLRLRDLADVELGARAYDFRTNISGKPGVMFYVKQAPGANATKVNAEIKKVLAQVEKRLPAGLQFKLLETSDDFLYASMYNVIETLIVAIILVILVVYFFLQNIRATIIPSITIIVSLIGTFAVVRMAGFSLNLLTLFAIVLAIGTVVDNAIVVVEAVMTKLEMGTLDIRRAVSDALSDVTAACISTTLVFMAVFIPVTFMSGTSGTFFKQFGITMASSVGISTVLALTLCPALCVLLMRPGSGPENKKGIGRYMWLAYSVSYSALLDRYTKSVTRFVSKSVYGWILLISFCVLTTFLVMRSKSELVPQEDQGFLLVNVMLAPGTYLDETEATTVKLENYIKSLDEVETVGALTGYSMMEDVTSTNYATLMVRLKNWSERPFFSIADIQQHISDWARINLPQADVTAFQMPQIPGYGNGSDISFNLQDLTRSANKNDFVAMGEKFVYNLDKRPEVEFASSTYSTDYPKYRLDVDEIACKRMGISPKTVLETIGTFLAGSYIGSYVQYNNVYRVMVQAGKEYRMSESTLNNIFVPVDGHMVPVSQFVTMRLDTGSAMDLHFNLFPSYPVSTYPAPGYTSDDARKAVDEEMRKIFPETFGYEYSGMAREEVENANSNETLLIYAICMLLIYLIMACLYDSLFIPMAVMLSIPFALAGAYLFIIPMESMGVGANVYVQTGIIMMIGLVAKTAILITEFAVQKRRDGLGIREAALGACKDRLRPILMTVFTMILGMLPLAIGSGAGAVGNRSLALAVIGGMTIGTIALLFVTPAFYMVFQKVHDKLTPWVPKILSISCILLLTTSCSLYRKYEAHETVPADIMGDVVQSDDTLSMGAISWQQMFTDPLLQQLIGQALQNNTDVQQAQLTVQQAQNDLSTARLGWLPVITFEPSGTLERLGGVATNSYIVPLTASWQLNIFGQVTSRKRQAKAYKYMREDYKQAVQANLAAGVAAAYYNLIMLDRELQILQETQVVWEESLEAMRTLFEAGLYMSPAVYQMEASLASVKSGIVDTRETIQTTEAALCLMLSEPPHHIVRSQYGQFVMPSQLHVGLPLRLLQARPDVRQAARNMEVAYYSTQQARQLFFPDITINATLGWSNGQGAVNPAQFLAQAVGSLVQPVFSQGRLRARYKNAKIDQEKARLLFVQTLLNAGNEVYRQMHICRKTEQKAAYLASIIQSLNNAYEGTRELMNNGTNTYVEVLKAQEDLLKAQITEVENNYEGIQAVINLYLALGGFAE